MDLKQSWGCKKCSSNKRTAKWKVRITDFFDGRSCKVSNPHGKNDHKRKEGIMAKEIDTSYMLKLVKEVWRQIPRNSS